MSKWQPAPIGMTENPGVFDNGNGAMMYVERNDAHSGIERVTVRSYCGRGHDNRRFYRLLDPPTGTFSTLAQAKRARFCIQKSC